MGPRGGLDGRKISSPPGFDPRTVQPVAQSLYRLSYRAHIKIIIIIMIIIIKILINKYGNLSSVYSPTWNKEDV